MNWLTDTLTYVWFHRTFTKPVLGPKTQKEAKSIRTLLDQLKLISFITQVNWQNSKREWLCWVLDQTYFNRSKKWNWEENYICSPSFPLCIPLCMSPYANPPFKTYPTLSGPIHIFRTWQQRHKWTLAMKIFMNHGIDVQNFLSKCYDLVYSFRKYICQALD